MPCELDVVIISYNTRDLTLACIESVARTTAAAHRVIVVDNASRDGSAGAIAGRFPDVRLIRSGANLGFAAAVNLAAAEAQSDWMLLLNPDAVALDGAIDILLDHARAGPADGVWGGLTIYPDGAVNPRCCLMRTTPWSLFCHSFGLSSLFRGSRLFDPEMIAARPMPTARSVDIVCGCFFLVSASLWRRLGGFDEAFFMYGEEADFCFRAAREGVVPTVQPDARIVHLSEGAAARRADPHIQNARARITLCRRYWRGPWRGAVRPLMWTWAASRLAASGVLLAAVPSERSRERYRVWRDVWRERAKWLLGYDELPPEHNQGG